MHLYIQGELREAKPFLNINQPKKKKSPISRISNMWDLASSLCGSDRTSVWAQANRSFCLLKLLLYVKLLHCLLGIFHWLLAQKPRTLNHKLAFLKENTSLFCFFSLYPCLSVIPAATCGDMYMSWTNCISPTLTALRCSIASRPSVTMERNSCL